MKNLLMGYITITIILIYSFSVYAANDNVLNVHSTTHTINAYSNKTQIGMTWNAYTTTVNYYYAFSTSGSYDIGDFDQSTQMTTIQSEDFSDAVSQSSNSSIAYYFHIRAKEGFFNWHTQTTHGPYYIDTKAPTNVSVSAPETTNAQVVTLSIYADGATEMYISNSGYGISGSWESYATSKQWTLTEGYETKTVYVIFRDAAGNETDGKSTNARTNIVYAENNAPEIRNLTASATGNPVSAPNIYFDLYDQEGGDIVLTVSSANSAATTPEDITITGVSVTGNSTTYTISSLTAAENKGLTLTIGSASQSLTTSVITLTVKDSGNLTSTQTVSYGNTNNLMVKISTFDIITKPDSMLIQWETASEIDTSGFIIKRSETKDGIYTQLSDLIDAKGSSIAGKAYEYEDDQIDVGKNYFYQLVEIDLNNNERICSVSTDVKRNGTSENPIDYDANADGDVNIGDVIFLLQQLTTFQ